MARDTVSGYYRFTGGYGVNEIHCFLFNQKQKYIKQIKNQVRPTWFFKLKCSKIKCRPIGDCVTCNDWLNGLCQQNSRGFKKVIIIVIQKL